MLILLACAKTMSEVSKLKTPAVTQPAFHREAAAIALQMSQFSVEELERLLHVNPKIALENYKRYRNFHSEDVRELPALLAYTGIVFKRLNPKDFSADDFLYAQDHLRLTSFCYGLLRPLDLIRLYRLEGDVRLPEPCTGRCLSIGNRCLQIILLRKSRKREVRYAIWPAMKCADYSIGNG